MFKKKRVNPIRFEEGDSVVYELSSKKMVNIGTWKQQNLFLCQIRDFFYGAKRQHLSCPKGIALTIEVWREFYKNIEEINHDCEDLYKRHLGQYSF
mmetsp:Transcript_19540/g.18653  ORF Transcript_19540/g.18653 Transcript_19540/m.18653 type:complete len:96 (-) Transcript_19540:19-306(-)